MAKHECETAASGERNRNIEQIEKSLIVEEQRKKRLCEEKGS